MAQSLVKLTLESNQYERGIRNAQKQLNDFTKSIGLNMKSLSAIGLAAGAVTGAMKVMKDAFFKNEQQLDEWGRTVKSAESLYSGFLNALNNGDIRGFLSNIDTITRAARAAYDALDNLSTFNAFNQINTQRARTGMAEAIAGFRMGEVSKADVQVAASAYKAELETRKKLEARAYVKEVERIAAERGISPILLKKALSGSYGNYESLKGLPLSGSRMTWTGGGMFGGSIAYEEKIAANTQEKLGDALRKLNDTELQALQALGAQAERTGEEIAGIDKQLARVLGGGRGGSGSGGSGGGGITYAADSIAAQEALVSSLTKKWREAGSEVREGYLKQLEIAKNDLDYMTGRKTVAGHMGLASGASPIGVGVVNPFITHKGVNPKLNNQEVKTVKMFEQFTSMNNGINSIAGGIESLGVELPEGLKNVLSGITGVIQILSGISTILIAIEAIAGADAIIPFARGGIVHAAGGYVVPGGHFSGDMVPAYLNSGELVLNRAQQASLANQLSEGSPFRNLTLTATLKGEDLRLSINRNGRRTGRGEIVTTNFK